MIPLDQRANRFGVYAALALRECHAQQRLAYPLSPLALLGWILLLSPQYHKGLAQQPQFMPGFTQKHWF
jgi:hypothetical protein